MWLGAPEALTCPRAACVREGAGVGAAPGAGWRSPSPSTVWRCAPPSTRDLPARRPWPVRAAGSRGDERRPGGEASGAGGVSCASVAAWRAQVL